jgi:delta1-piperideine-2-carboxylate reductase
MDVELSIEDARALAERVLIAQGQRADYASLIADHLIDCELRGLDYGGLPRLVSIVERLERTGPPPGPVEIVHETPVSAKIKGKDNLGYVVAYKATEIAIAKAKNMGLAAVVGDDTWYTGMLSYFAEMMAAEGLVSMIASNASPWVAPEGAVDGRFGTNPICYGFPSLGDPIIWDIGTSNIMHAEVLLAKRLGKPLDPGKAWDASGKPTTDPDAALAGAFTAWGGHKGSGLAHVVQLLGAMAGSPVMPPDLAKFGFVVIAMKPNLFNPEADFRAAVSEYADAVRTARPVSGGAQPRMPFDRSAALRRERKAADVIRTPRLAYDRLLAMGGS